jgi:transmembrane sensor
MPENQEVDDVMRRQAIAWYVRLKDASATAKDGAAFRRWASADPGHLAAFAEAERLWEQVGRPAAELGAGGWYRPAPPRRSLFRPMLAAALLAACAAIVWWRDPGIVHRALADHATARGERRESVLGDGTRAYLDGDSAISVTIGPAARDVRLLRGRAWFDVKPDRAAPFRVIMEDVEARVLGTAFAVERRAADSVVTVERGRVAVVARGRPEVLVTGGQRVRIEQGVPIGPEPVDTDIALAWRRGLLVFDRASLGAIVEELDRMSSGRVLVADDALQQLTLSGVFRVDDSAAILAALRGALHVKVATIPGVTTVIYR